MKYFAKFDTDVATFARFQTFSLAGTCRLSLTHACNQTYSVCPMFPNACGTAAVSCSVGVDNQYWPLQRSEGNFRRLEHEGAVFV